MTYQTKEMRPQSGEDTGLIDQSCYLRYEDQHGVRHQVRFSKWWQAASYMIAFKIKGAELVDAKEIEGKDRRAEA